MTSTTTTDDGAAIRGGGFWLVLLGVLALVLGLAGLVMTFALTIVGTIWYGALLAILGIAHIVQALFGKAKDGRLINLLLGVIYAAAGFFVMANPLAASLGLTLFIGITLSVLGLARAIWAFWYPGLRKKLWGVLGGLLSVALGALIVLGWPWTGLWVVGLFIATDMIVYGLTMIGVGWRYR